MFLRLVSPASLKQVKEQALWPCSARTYQGGAPGQNVLASGEFSSHVKASSQNFYPGTNQKNEKLVRPGTSPKNSTLPPRTAAGSTSLRVLPRKTRAKDFGTDDKIFSQSLKAGQGTSPAALFCKNIPGRSTRAECSCLW